jgi:hypothetical protein
VGGLVGITDSLGATVGLGRLDGVPGDRLEVGSTLAVGCVEGVAGAVALGDWFGVALGTDVGLEVGD